jgi:hypothetical protein
MRCHACSVLPVSCLRQKRDLAPGTGQLERIAASSPRNADSTTRARLELRPSQRREALHADVTAAHKCLRREQAEHFGWCKYLPLPRASNLSRCDGPQPAALRTAGSMLVQCSRCLPVGRAADARSDARTPKHRCADCAEHFGSPSIGCGNRTDSRLGRGSAAFVPDAQWGGACLGSPSWSSSGQWIGARSSPRSGRTLRQGKGGCGGIAHFHSPQWSSRSWPIVRRTPC